ncbi:hypothetical protein A0J61_09840 [Choanephora cucurbitarum]|uniref:Uncharacterized protein n=1 Tax=Choanephora cucurbitarum TaxID=101091 RepID=A0A1C7MZ24_9FUNG|nr:hypothetical protein A0J61_09840 [Choanephora cucurbitarum]
MYTLYCLVFFILSTLTCAQNLIRIDAPKPNDVIKSKEVFDIKYSVIGSQTLSPPVNSYYPSSLSASFSWSERANQSNSHSFNVASSLKTNGYPGGSQNVQHSESWKVPGCHFFSRYPPASFDFSLTFTPVYADAQATGTPQDTIIIPVSVTVDNSTFPKC